MGVCSCVIGPRMALLTYMAKFNIAFSVEKRVLEEKSCFHSLVVEIHQEF